MIDVKKVKMYKGFTIATDGINYMVISKDEMEYGLKNAEVEFEAGNLQEAMDFIASY